jgi:non-ribosomal peptide synthetase component E (peptide arylation enzyme)
MEKKKKSDLETSYALASHRVSELNKLAAYQAGQLSVLKRITKLFPEEEMTKEEFQNSQREILYSPTDNFLRLLND